MTSRLAPGGVQELRAIQLDLTTLGKFGGGGFAFGAFGGSRAVMRHLDVRAGGALSQGGTFNNNVIAMTAGLPDPGQVEASDSPRRRLFHLELLERGFYIAQRGMINLSLPMTEHDMAGFLIAVRDYLMKHADILRLI